MENREKLVEIKQDWIDREEYPGDVQDVVWLIDQIELLLNREVIYREALSYYADPGHYEEFVTMGGARQPGVLTEGGDKARKALQS